jgi:hypothetical protein
MPEIIDVLTTLPSDSPRFIVNNAVDYLGLTYPTAAPYFLVNSSGASLFQKGDNFAILSAGYNLPEGFMLWKDPATLGVKQLVANMIYIYGAVSHKDYHIDVLGNLTSVFIPLDNFELSLDVFVSCQKQSQYLVVPTTYLSEQFSLVTGANNINVSMKSVPAAYNGKTLSLSPFFKILHNFPMV